MEDHVNLAELFQRHELTGANAAQGGEIRFHLTRSRVVKVARRLTVSRCNAQQLEA
jgi:hypothetical protein